MISIAYFDYSFLGPPKPLGVHIRVKMTRQHCWLIYIEFKVAPRWKILSPDTCGVCFSNARRSVWG
jgi:hypothetical protein